MPIFDVLETALTEVHEGNLEAKRASAMAAIAGAMVRVLSAGELEDRVRRLEERSNRAVG
jgi:O-acetylhomoserine/O-acetylserine sulfhydrylase-like pyridoxal-dependent enzyme